MIFNMIPSIVYHIDDKFKIKDHWVTKDYGFDVYNHPNPVDRRIYIKLGDEYFVRVFPELIEDTPQFELMMEHYGYKKIIL